MSDAAAAATSVTSARVALLMRQEAMDIAALPSDTAAFKNSELPLARIKKIMKLDEDIRGMMIAAEAPLLFSKAAELLIKELTLRAWIHTERQRRRTLQRADISASVYDQDTDQFDFLIDIVPREEMPTPQPHQQSQSAAAQPPLGVTPSLTSAASTPAMPAVSLAAELMDQQAIQRASPAAHIVTSSQQQQVQYVIQLANGQQQLHQAPMQMAFLPTQEQQQQVQHPVLHFATASGSDGQQDVLEVKPDISQMALSAGPVPVSFAGL